MSVREVVRGGSTRVKMLLASTGLLAALFMLAPREVHGAKTWLECVDSAFAEYNSCLMNGSGWFHNTLCDLDWELKVAYCSALETGRIKKAYEEGSEQPR